MDTCKKKKNRMLWCISKWFLFLSPCQKLDGTFFDIYCGNLVELLEVNLTILWVPPCGWVSLEFKLLELSTLSLQQFINYSSSFPTWPCFLW